MWRVDFIFTSLPLAPAGLSAAAVRCFALLKPLPGIEDCEIMCIKGAKDPIPKTYMRAGGDLQHLQKVLGTSLIDFLHGLLLLEHQFVKHADEGHCLLASMLTEVSHLFFYLLRLKVSIYLLKFNFLRSFLTTRKDPKIWMKPGRGRKYSAWSRRTRDSSQRYVETWVLGSFNTHCFAIFYPRKWLQKSKAPHSSSRSSSWSKR